MLILLVRLGLSPFNSFRGILQLINLEHMVMAKLLKTLFMNNVPWREEVLGRRLPILFIRNQALIERSGRNVQHTKVKASQKMIPKNYGERLQRSKALKRN